MSDIAQNSPAGPSPDRLLLGSDQVDGVTSAMGNLWLDRPITVSGIEIGAGQATLHTLTSYGAAQDIELRTNADGFVDRFAVKLQPPKINDWRDIDAVLTKSGARYSYQVSKVVQDGPAAKCVPIAGTNAQQSLPRRCLAEKQDACYRQMAAPPARIAGTAESGPPFWKRRKNAIVPAPTQRPASRE